jgi:hypothetical protein
MGWIRYRVGGELDPDMRQGEGAIDSSKIVQVIVCEKWGSEEAKKYGEYKKPYPGMFDNVAAIIECEGKVTIFLREHEWLEVKPQLKGF